MPNFSAQCVKGVQGIGYVCALLLSMCICVPMSMHQDQFRGRCLLFSTGVWQEKDGQFIVSWASQAYCNYTIFVSVIMMVISSFQFFRFVKFFYKGRDSTFLSAFVDVIVCIFMTMLTLTAALFVTLGFKVWCEQITKRFENCSEAVGSNTIDKADQIDTSDFFNQMVTAQFGIWTSFTVWFTIMVFSIVKLCRYHHEENLRVSMAKERKRLINEDLVSEVPPSTSQPSGHRRRFNVRGRTAASQAAIPESNEDNEVIVHQEEGHRGPFNDDIAIAQDVLDDVAVQKQIQQRLEAGSLDRSSDNSGVGGTNNPATGQNSFSYNSDHERHSSSSFGSSHSTHQSIQGNQLRVEADPTNPWN